jgi:hypothetical protein
MTADVDGPAVSFFVGRTGGGIRVCRPVGTSMIAAAPVVQEGFQFLPSNDRNAFSYDKPRAKRSATAAIWMQHCPLGRTTGLVLSIPNGCR